jgi:tetratricopeptide (TPR) repeat protein
MRRAVAVAALLVSLPIGGRARAAEKITGTTLVAVRNWVSAVRGHTPGRRDAAATTIATLTFDKRRELNVGMPLFLSVLLGNSPVMKIGPEKHISDLALQARHAPGADIFLKRAVVLHSDAALENQVDDPKPPEPVEPAPPGAAPPPPLLSRHRLFLDKDGEILGQTMADWNWPFARSLLDLLSARPGDDPFAGVWYHATTAFLFQKSSYGEVVTHLQRAAEVLPDDPQVLFDRGCFAEIQGLPRSQVLLSDGDLVVLRAQRNGQRPPRQIASQAAELGIPPGDASNADAERLLRHALRVDPSLVEARVRLARLLEERKHYDEAAAELGTAVEGKPTGIVLFYAHLFAGRAAQALGRIDEAAVHYREAATLYPGAQSALLALSQVALLGADMTGALEPIHRMDVPPATALQRDDPWWRSHLAAGRDADALLRGMWAAVPR